MVYSMAGSIYGRLFQISTWGESHGKGIGVVIDGCPAGLSLSEEDIQVYLDRRKPGQSQFTTGRKESDMAQIWSGVFEGRTTGTPISILVQNQDQRSRDYGNIMNTYRPGHADYTFDEKYEQSVKQELGSNAYDTKVVFLKNEYKNFSLKKITFDNAFDGFDERQTFNILHNYYIEKYNLTNEILEKDYVVKLSYF